MPRKTPGRSSKGSERQPTGTWETEGLSEGAFRINPKQSLNRSGFHAINVRCLELLIDAAQHSTPTNFPLVQELHEVFSSISPEEQARAARCPVLLVDMHFSDVGWWRGATEQPLRAAPLAASQGAFSKSGGILLARATLTLAWHTAHAAPYHASLLGMTTDVASLIGNLPITEIERVAEKRFKHARPRWEDRPAIWRRLLLSAQSDSLLRARDFSLYSLQLLTADVLSPLRSIDAS